MRFAAAFGNDASRCATVVRQMLAAQALPDASTAVLTTSAGALGVVTRPGRAAELHRFVVQAPSGATVVIAGTPIRVGGSLDAELAAAAAAEPDEAIARLDALDGAFAAWHWHPAADRLALVTDFLGMAPVFESTVAGWRLLASSERALMASGLISLAPDAAGWGAFLGLGQPLSGRTKVAAIRRVPAACCRTMDGAGRTLAERTSWHWPAPAADAPATLEDVVAPIAASVAAYQDAYAPDVQLFSGGYDSRVIANLVQEAGARPIAIIQSQPDQRADADGVFGRMAVERLGWPYEWHTAPRDFFNSPDYRRYRELGDLAVPSIGLFICTTPRLLRADRQAVWTDTLVGPALMRITSRGSAEQTIRSLMQPERAARRIQALRVFTPEWRQAMIEGVDEGLAAELASAPDGEVAERMLFVSLRTRLRIGAHFYRVHDALLPAATPGATRETWRMAAQLPVVGARALRRYEALHRTRFPLTADVPFLSGSSLRALTPVAWPAYLRQLATAHVHELARRPKVARMLGRARLPAPFAWDSPDEVGSALRAAAGPPDAILDQGAITAMLDGRVTATREELLALTYWGWQARLPRPGASG